MAAEKARVRRASVLVLVAGAALCSCLRAAFVSPPAHGDGRRRALAAAVGGVLATTAAEQHTEAAIEYARKVTYGPINRKDKNRCQWQSSSMGQANAARNEIFDLRECDMSGTNAASKDIAGVVLNQGKFEGTSFEGTVMSKAVAEKADFTNANFRNAVADRVDFKFANFNGAIFENTVLTGSNFEGADLTNADFTDALIAAYDVKGMCDNPTMKGTNPKTGADTWESAGCFNKGLAR